MLEHFTKARFSIFDIQVHKDRETIILHDENKENIPYEDTPEIIRMRNVLSSYNELLRNTHIDCSHLDNPYVVKNNGNKVHINQYHKFVYRVFNNSNFEQGGRFYGGWWQSISEHRKGIRIDGRRTIEIDYSGLHPTLLYARKNIHYFDEMGAASDPYEINVPELKTKRFSRWVAKTMLLDVINAADELKAFQAVIDKTTKEKKKDPDLVPPELKDQKPLLPHDLLGKVLEQLREKHSRIADMFLSGAGIDLQYIDSQMTEKIIQHFTSLGIVVLPIHDSYVVKEEDLDDLRDLMYQAFQEATQLTHKEDAFGDTTYDWALTKQIGYPSSGGEYAYEDPELDLKMLQEMDKEYVSQRYLDDLALFKEWKKIRRY